MNELFNRYANGVRAHADDVGVKQANVSFETARSIVHNREWPVIAGILRHDGTAG